ncbi:LysR family transcriptional regulator [Kribbella sp. NPDC006257]|uniref:helix-turn-helix domain-containing protein n=1 Tax=Kribbella sp. NPDC006257 TaxID=3156738 RepID=UPI0033A24DBC
MDLEAVRTFAAVVDSGQFQAAADELGVTQQAVSKRLAALERELGVLAPGQPPPGSRRLPHPPPDLPGQQLRRDLGPGLGRLECRA